MVETVNHTLAATPLLGVRPVALLSATGTLFKAVGKTPIKGVQHVGSYLKQLRNIVAGTSSVTPNSRDKRFADPAWQSNALLRVLLQSYLAGNDELNRFIEAANLDPRDKGRARFIAELLFDALAPSNLLLTNPAALRKLIDTGGMSFLKGVKQFSSDLRHNRGMPMQVDSAPFKVGENVATAKGQVVFRNEMFELLQFSPTTKKVYARPLVMSPPQINKYYAIDLSPDKSLIKWMQDSGIQLFVISWRNRTGGSGSSNGQDPPGRQPGSLAQAYTRPCTLHRAVTCWSAEGKQATRPTSAKLSRKVKSQSPGALNMSLIANPEMCTTQIPSERFPSWLTTKLPCAICASFSMKCSKSPNCGPNCRPWPKWWTKTLPAPSLKKPAKSSRVLSHR